MTTLAHTQTTASAATNRDAEEKPIGFVRATVYAVAFFALMTAVTATAIRQGHFTPRLAANLMKQSDQLSAAGDQAGALAASRKATEINHLLLRVSTDHYPPHLAANLHDLSARLSEAGDSVGALAAIREAIAIRRRLAKDGGQYAPSLEQSLQLLARIETAERPAVPGVRTADSTVR
jgi:hypothetical protein